MSLMRPFAIVGGMALGTVEFLGGMTLLFRDAISSARLGLFGKRGRRLGWSNLWYQMVRVGVRSIPIVSLVVFCIGAILSLQMAPILEDFGGVTFVPDIIAIAMFRELGPLVAAIVLTGYAGASMAAEIGTMTVSEEIEALQAHAISPTRFLVMPRVIATIIMTTCLAVVADIMGVTGGLLVSYFFLDISVTSYASRTFNAVQIQDFLTGLIKATVFGSIISTLACYLGLTVKGGASGVGAATTKTVVYTIVMLILVDLLFTAIFFALDF